ncbi:hypothetical protein E2C01_004220 [Portunus trituberculatus]|uniref:Uncharacterized protein n=1 Tax=Portunus trituberculatus TaxID=210409 RepID=A0A5B7CPC6_PORTR|nr:hypothetical protein [Portunus trituberculatus]
MSSSPHNRAATAAPHHHHMCNAKSLANISVASRREQIGRLTWHHWRQIIMSPRVFAKENKTGVTNTPRSSYRHGKTRKYW